MNPVLLRRDYRVFLAIIAALLITGCIFVYSSSSVFALEKFGSEYYFLKKQLIGIAIGLLSIIAFQFVSASTIQRASPVLFLLSLIATALTLIPSLSLTLHGSHRWLSLPGITMQPSEMLKIFFVLYLANVLSKKRYKHSFWYGFLPVFAIAIPPSIILLLQPDFGLTVTLFLTMLIMLFLANFQLQHILIAIGSLIPPAIGLILLKPYRLQRVMTFLNPWQDPKGAGFQVIQSLIAIGSGGPFGLGIGQSKQKFFYLPMQHTDFIFSIIAEETGFVGVFILISLYVALLYYGIKIVHQLSSHFAKLTILGFVFLVNLQAMINIAVAASLIPTKGIGLPFVSYGNSALICNLWMIGIIINLAKHEML
jgi:cell division protein FtsW